MARPYHKSRPNPTYMIHARGFFGSWLGKRIMKKGMTIAEFGKDIGLNRDTVCSHLYKYRSPYRNTLLLYANYFQCPIEDLIERVAKDEVYRRK